MKTPSSVVAPDPMQAARNGTEPETKVIAWLGTRSFWNLNFVRPRRVIAASNMLAARPSPRIKLRSSAQPLTFGICTKLTQLRFSDSNQMGVDSKSRENSIELYRFKISDSTLILALLGWISIGRGPAVSLSNPLTSTVKSLGSRTDSLPSSRVQTFSQDHS